MNKTYKKICLCVIGGALTIAIAHAEIIGGPNRPFTEESSRTAAFEEFAGSTTTTVLTATPNPVVQGATATLTATVTASTGTATGVVRFAAGSYLLGTCTLVSGSCSYTASSSGIQPGTYMVTADYEGDSNDIPSDSTPVSIVVELVKTTTTLLASPNSVIAGTSVTLNALVAPATGYSNTGNLTGTVRFSYGGDILGSCALSEGYCSFTASSHGIPAGTYGVTATFTGSGPYLPSASAAVPITVVPSLAYDETGLHNFGSYISPQVTDGGQPFGSLITDSQNNLYGTTMGGGAAGKGTVFKLSPSGVETILYSFTGEEDGGYPEGGVIMDSAGNLYGTFIYSSEAPYGGVFKLTPGAVESVLYVFNVNGADGLASSPLVEDASGNLYGVTQTGGRSQQGSVFSVNSVTGKETTLYSFTGGSDGGQPMQYYMGLILDATGNNLYGTTMKGGYDFGTVFKIDIQSGVESVVYNFSSGSDGSTPYAGVTLDAQGNLYGTTQLGGTAGAGTVFEVSATGTESILYSFKNGADGGYPQTGLTLDGKGNVYGNTGNLYDLSNSGYPQGFGTVFKLNGKVLTTLFTFNYDPAGVSADGKLLLDAQGNLYGVCAFGGSIGQGLAYELSPPK